MAYYFIANIKIHNPVDYQKYLDRCQHVFDKYSGKYLVVDNDPVVLEGKWEFDRIVLISFPTVEDFNDWYHSPDYQEIVKYRLENALCNTILAKGL